MKERNLSEVSFRVLMYDLLIKKSVFDQLFYNTYQSCPKIFKSVQVKFLLKFTKSLPKKYPAKLTTAIGRQKTQRIQRK
jgi:hypothetical protein